MPTIENFATVNYTSNGVAATKVSNLAETQLESSVLFSKNVLGSTYSDGDVVTYIMTITNASTSAVPNISIFDNLGQFTEGASELTPLNYLGPAVLLINGQDVSAQLTVTEQPQGGITFSFPSLASGATANIVYRTVVNEYAPLAQGSTIINTADLTSDSACADTSASATVTAAVAADVSVFKQMCPNPVICGETLTYTIRIYNYGNIAAENVQLVDAFDPAPANITVAEGGVILSPEIYTYAGNVLTVPTSVTENPIIVPAATFTRDETTGVVSVTPGVVEFVVTGTI